MPIVLTRLVLVLAVLLGLPPAAPLAAQPVVRCEAADGRVTYTNEPCPGATPRTRAVNDTPAVQAGRTAPDTADKADKADKAAMPAAAARGADIGPTRPAAPAHSAERTGAAHGAEAARAMAPAGRAQPGIEPSRTASNLTAAQQLEQLDQEHARQQVQCTQLQRRIGFARNDVDTAFGGQRASAELQLRRLQDEYQSLCPAQP
jgi:hypothetical protein